MFRGLLLMLCACALLAPMTATAAQDEIFVDPGSPSGKEYALPIDSARKQAAGGAGSKGSPTKQAPLFGEGVGAKVGGGAGGGGSSGSGGSADGAGGKAGTQRNDADGGSPVTARAQAASPEGGIATLAFIGAGAGVLLLGGAIGLILRRRAARTT